MSTPITASAGNIPDDLLALINSYGRACRRDGNPAWESDEGVALKAALAGATFAVPPPVSVAPPFPHGLLAVRERQVVQDLLDLAHALFVALDNSEERNGEDRVEHVIDAAYFDPVCAAMDRLDALPDDQPGYTMDPPAKAAWALRSPLQSRSAGLAASTDAPRANEADPGSRAPRPLASERKALAKSVFGGISALRWVLNITTEFDRKDVPTRQAARLLDNCFNGGGVSNRVQLEHLWKTLNDELSTGDIIECLGSEKPAAAPSRERDGVHPVRTDTHSLYKAIEQVLLHHRLSNWHDQYENELPLVDRLCDHEAKDIASGQHQIRLICDEIYNQVLTRGRIPGSVLAAEARFLFIAMDDDHKAHITFCADESEVYDAVRRSMYTHVHLDRYEEEQVQGSTNALLEDGHLRLEGDPDRYLYRVTGIANRPPEGSDE